MGGNHLPKKMEMRTRRLGSGERMRVRWQDCTQRHTNEAEVDEAKTEEQCCERARGATVPLRNM